jgi:hypothetical protein
MRNTGLASRLAALAAASVFASAFFSPSSRASDPLSPLAQQAHAAILALDLGAAREQLARLAPDDPEANVERARLFIYEGRFDEAVANLSRADVQKRESADELLDIARGSARVTSATSVILDGPSGVEIRFQDDNDRGLAPFIIAATVKARDSLTRELGVDWPTPTRITVVRDLLSLSAMTGLPYEAATTTGTVAVAKWGRVTLLSPRAPRHGYGIEDTIAHEFTHMAITRATADRAPLWLQEGLAKYEETRWRPASAFDERPSSDAIASRGIELHLDLPLDGLGPSIAMLPTPERAMVAYAEVSSFVRFLARATAPTFLRDFLRAVREQSSVDAALQSVTGLGVAAWEPRWRTYLQSRPKETVPGLGGAKGPAPKGVRELRERVRLSELLLGRGHGPAAAIELSAIAAEFASDPRVRYLRAREREFAGNPDAALSALGDPSEMLMPYGPCLAVRGRLSDAASASIAFAEGRAVDPLETEVACEKRDSEAMTETNPTPLCAAARTRREPLLGRD